MHLVEATEVFILSCLSNTKREKKISSKKQIVREIGEKLQRSAEKRERLLVRVIGKFENLGLEKSGFHYISINIGGSNK